MRTVRLVSRWELGLRLGLGQEDVIGIVIGAGFGIGHLGTEHEMNLHGGRHKGWKWVLRSVGLDIALR